MKKLWMMFACSLVVACGGEVDEPATSNSQPRKQCMTPAGTFQQSWTLMTDECVFGELPAREVELVSESCFSREEKYEEDLGAGCSLEIVMTLNGNESGYGGQQFDRVVCNGEQKCLTMYRVDYILR